MSDQIEILRLLRYRYQNIEAMQADMQNWGMPANGVSGKRTGTRMQIASSVLPLMLVQDPPAPVAYSAAIYTVQANEFAEAHPNMIDAPESLAAEVCEALGWGYEHDGTGHLVYVPQATQHQLELYKHLTFKVSNYLAEVCIEIETED